MKILAKFVGFVMALVVAFISGVLTSDQFRGALCEHTSASVASAASWFCTDQYRAVSTAEAASVVDSFLGHAGGAQKDAAWYLLAPRMQRLDPRRQFLSEWSNVLWAERRGRLVKQAEGFNRFAVTYRVFTANRDGSPNRLVNVYNAVFQINDTTTEPLIFDIGAPSRLTTEKLVIPYVQINVASTRAYAGPSVADTDGGDPTVGPGSVYVFCRMTEPDGVWVNTAHEGWFPARDFNGGAASVAAASTCDSHHH